MVQKNATPELITPEEAAELTHKAGTVDDSIRGEAIYNTYIETTPPEKIAKYRSFVTFCAIGAIYAAGRIQGIREERQRRRTRKPRK